MEIHFEIENKCMLQCIHCSSFASNNGKKMEYTAQEMIIFMKRIPEHKYVFLTGGEPLLYDGLKKLISELKTVENIDIGLFTTGIIENPNGCYVAISEQQMKGLALAGLNICYFSAYSTQAVQHDQMTGVHGSYDMTWLAVKRAVKYNIDARVNLVLTNRNISHIGDIINMAQERGCSEVRLLKLVNHGRARKCWEELGISDETYKELVEKYTHEQLGIRVTASGCPDILPCRPFSDVAGCPAGKHLLYVTYQGLIYPCASAKNNKEWQWGDIRNVDFIKSKESTSLFCQKSKEFLDFEK